MRKIIRGQVYDTKTAECLLSKKWKTYHPNQGGGSPTLRHEREVYRTKKGALFSYVLDDRGYGRDRNGVTGMYTETTQSLYVFVNDLEAVAWCEEQDFDVDEVEKHFAVEEA